jgi:type III pantothenate kinase
MSGRKLLIDAGNTRLKWAIVEAGGWCEQGSVAYPDLSALAPLVESASRCYIASVASAQQESQIKALFATAAIAPTWLASAAEFSDIKNDYADPQQLGVDRWMSLIAARQRIREAVLVVSAGTAMTIDALTAEGRFLGGLIVPGYALMQQALRQGTARVDAVDGACHAFPRSMADAVQSGIVAALCGAIQRQHAHLAERAGGVPQCMLTGGDAERLLPYLTIPAQHVPVLVLEGIDCVARQEEKA